ncbi:MAG: glucodextranase DOMON-like domain-containing protein [Elusimicrobiota bacterium]
MKLISATVARAAVLAVLAAFAMSIPAAHAAWGRTKDENRIILLWVPEMGTVDWNAFQSLIERHPDVRLTVALSPAEIPEEVRPWLSAWAREGRLEVALRITGDPILPLITKYRQRDAVDRIALARIQYRDVFERFPGGFVPGDGALIPAFARPLEMQHFKWAAVGDAVFRTPWYTGGKEPMVAIPFHVPESTAPVALANLQDIRAVVLSELNGTLTPGGGVEALTALFEETRNDLWTSAQEAIELINPYAVGPEEWPTWSGDLLLWTEDPIQERAWHLYEITVGALSRYQNSGAASLDTLDRANTHIYRAQDSRYFRVDSLHNRQMERRFRGHLQRVYRTLGQKAPQALATPIAVRHTPASGGENAEQPDEAAQNGAKIKGDAAVRSRLADGLLTFENPAASTATLPTQLPELPPGTTPHHLWTPQSLTVSWDEESVTFSVVPRDILKSAAPNGFAAPMFELYMDLNNLAGRGSTALLPGRRGFVPSSDAWEYAVIANGWEASLYRAVPSQPPALVEKLGCTLDAKAGAIRVSVPRQRLRGSPSGWGYVLLTLAVDEAGARQTPPQPLPGGNGSPLLGILGGLDTQRRLTDSKSSYRRVSAVRLQESATLDR